MCRRGESKVALNGLRFELGDLGCVCWGLTDPRPKIPVYAPPPFPPHRHDIMVRGKRTGAIPATVFFEEEPATGLEIFEYVAPSIRTFWSHCAPPFTYCLSELLLFRCKWRSLTLLWSFQARQTREYVERIKQGAKKLQSAQREALNQIRENKRDFEYSAFRDEQKAKLDAVDAYLESTKAEFETTKSHMDVDAPTASSSIPHPSLRSADTSSAPSGMAIGASAVVESMVGMSALEKATMTHRLKTSQIRLELLARKERDEKVNTVFEALPHLTEEEVNTGLRLLGDDEFDVIEEFERFPELRGLRHTIARQYTDEARKARPKAKRSARGASKATDSGDVAPAKTSGSTKAKRGSAKSAAAKSMAAAAQMSASSNAPQASPRFLHASHPQHSHEELSASSAPGNARDPQLEAIAALLPQGVDLTESRMGLSASGSNNGSKYDETESDGAEDGYDSDGAGGDDFATRTHKKKKQVTVKKLKLDDAIAQGSMEGWSTARVRAWNLRHENPNAYYYRFNHPGEVQRNGKWTDEEREIFLARMQEVGVNGQWGIFAKEIYGRVGYQCANFYRQMIENAEIEDPRYVIDENGKAHFLFSKRKGRSSSSTPSDATPQSHSPSGTGDDEMDEGEMQLDGLTKLTRDGRDIYIPKINVPIRRVSNAAAPSAPAKPRSSAKSVTAIDPFLGAGSTAADRVLTSSSSATTTGAGAGGGSTSKSGGGASRGGASSSGAAGAEAKPKKKAMKKRKRDSDGGDADYKPSSTWARERADREAVAAQKNRMDSNPLPGFLDVITNSELIEPAISPYGHVLSYSTWLKCLSAEPKNTCPFTKKLIKKRDLIILTWENVDRYKDKIDRSGQ